MIVLRMLAVIVAVGGIVDPAIQVTRAEPLPVRLFGAPDDPDAAAAASTLRTALSGLAAVVDAGSGAATVVIGRGPIMPAITGGGPVSVVSLEEPPSVSIVDVPSAVTLIPGSAVDIPVTLQAFGLTGHRSVIVLQEDGVELSRMEHVWRSDARVTITMTYLGASPGARRLTVRVHPSPGERRIVDNQADLLAMVAARPGRVAVVETRPSWPAAFVRRSLEVDPAFQVSSVIRTSRGVASRAGETPPVIHASQLSRFDVVIVGAPEDLRREEIGALWRFVERRGGTLVLLPDRIPTGPYAQWLPGKFSEHLLNEPRALEPWNVLASELVTMTTMPRAGRGIGTLDNAPVIVWWPAGDGRVIFSGALDAWRYRAAPKSGFAPFWRQELLTAALSAPLPIRIDLRPAVVRPGGAVRMEVRLRRTEWVGPDPTTHETRLPAIAARISDSSGKLETIRLWPDAEPGVFHGDVTVTTAGIHTVRVETDHHATEATLLVDAGAAPLVGPSFDLARVATITGGVAVNASEINRVAEHLSALPRSSRPTQIRPFEGAAWPWIFASLLCGEWALRRRAGQR